MAKLEHLDWPPLLRHLESLATSESAREDLRNLQALSTPDEALKSFDEIEEARIIVASGRRPSMASLDFFPSWNDRVKKSAVLKTLEIKDVRRFCYDVADLRGAASSYTSPWLREIFQKLFDPSDAISAIDQIITAGGEIRSDASEELASLYKAKQDTERFLHSTLNKIVKKHNLESIIQDRFVTNREGRWVLPIKSGMQHNFEGIIHDASQSKQTVFMEPQEVVSINNDIREIEIKIEKEIEHLLTELSHYLHGLNRNFENAKYLLKVADQRMAQAQLSLQLNAQPCRFSKIIKLDELKHPLLSLQSGNVISNDVALDDERRILLLSGPNAGGKTVLLKAIGLASQMARCGLPICAEDSSEIPFFKDIVVAVGDEQSVNRNLSTFAAHLKILSEATQVQGCDHLILIDEICSATDPDEGSALAKAFIETFAKNEVYAVVTSHLGALKEGWTKEMGVINGRLEYDEVEGHSTYKLFMGLPGQSQALKTAQSIGVSKALIDRAVELLHPETRQRKRKLDELEAIKNEMIQSKAHLDSERNKFEELKKRYEDLIEKFKGNRETWLSKSVKLAEQRIDEMIDVSKSSSKALLEVKSQLPTIIKSAQKSSLSTADDFSMTFPRGSPVFVPALQVDGIIQSLPDAKGMVSVLAQSMRVQIHWKELQNPRNIKPTSSAPRSTLSLGGSEERIIDLRGQRVDEAIRELDSQLDLALRNKEDRVKIIHGHGTEALKKSIRSFLSRSVYVRQWRSGDVSSGGDGITWVELAEL